MEGEPGADQQDEENVDEEEEEEEEEEDEGGAEETDSSKLYQQLFQTYQKISAQLMGEDGMEEVAREYTRLFDAAKAWRIQGDDLSDRVGQLEEELGEVSFKYSECKKYAISLREEVAVLKQDLSETKRLADTANTREQTAVEVVAGLRTELARVSKELGQKARVVPIDDDPLAVGKRGGEGEVREQDRLASELAVVRERLERAVSYSRDVEKSNAAREKRIEELMEQLEVQEAETSKEMRLKERFESELGTARGELEQREQEMAALTESYDKTSKEFKALGDNYKELRVQADRLQRENELLNTRNNRLTRDNTTQHDALNNLRLDIEQRKRLFKMMELEIRRQTKEMSEWQRQREVASRKAELAVAARSEAMQEVDRLRNTVINGLEHDLRLAQNITMNDTRTIERLNRDKEILSKTNTRCQGTDSETALKDRPC